MGDKGGQGRAGVEGEKKKQERRDVPQCRSLVGEMEKRNKEIDTNTSSPFYK